MSSNETAAYKIMKMLDVDYVLVIFGGVIGYSGDDINKFLWMVRIAEGEHPQEIKVNQQVDSPNSLHRFGLFSVGEDMFYLVILLRLSRMRMVFKQGYDERREA